jgi:hypothetical protein
MSCGQHLEETLVWGEELMSLIRLIPAALILFMPGPALAQEWIEYTSRVDRFSVNFPSEPKVQDIQYKTFMDGVFPARIYGVEVPPSRYYAGTSRYSVTVVDYTDAERIHTERAKTCNPDAQTTCVGNIAQQGAGAWKYDVRGAMDWASEQFLKRDAKVTLFVWAVIDLIEGRQIHLTNADRSRTFAGIHMHENRLYIFEATVPPGAPEPLIFHQSPRFLDADGRNVRYATIYTNGFPAPPRVGGGGQQGQAGGPQGRAQ